ncbi:MAG: copper transporter [Actinomycetota bacterium]
MISWRYHLVSIVAVFLALGLGVLAGTTVLNGNLVRNLKGQTRSLQADLGDLRASVDNLRAQLATMNAFADEAMPYLVGQKLAGEQVVVVTEDGVDARAVAEIRRALDMAGAQVLTTLTVRSSMAAATPSSQRDLAILLGMAPGTSADELAGAAARSLADRLAKDPRGDLSGSPDLLGDMLSQGFLVASAPGVNKTTLDGIGGRGQLVVVIGGGPVDQLAPASAVFLAPFVGDLLDAGVIVGAGEGVAADDGFVRDLRSSLDVASVPLVTVDNVELVVGSTAMALGLADAVHSGIGGNYGVKSGTSGLLPPAT